MLLIRSAVCAAALAAAGAAMSARAQPSPAGGLGVSADRQAAVEPVYADPQAAVEPAYADPQAAIEPADAVPAAFASTAPMKVEFIPSTAAHAYAASTYRAIWDAYGARIVASLETRTCLEFPEAEVQAVIADASSHSGGPEHAMGLRASYAADAKQGTLVHELGHRHLWQLAERLDDVDGHRTLYLVLDRVWADVWGEEFAEQRVRGESEWIAGYDYAGAWSWARSLTPRERSRIWNRLLAKNGIAEGCGGLTDDSPLR